MADTRISKSESSFRKANLYKDATMNALKEVTEFDSKIINSNDRYLETLKEGIRRILKTKNFMKNSRIIIKIILCKFLHQ